MPPFGPISRWELLRGLRAAGFAGPYSGGKHPFMLKAFRGSSGKAWADQGLELTSPHGA